MRQASVTTHRDPVELRDDWLRLQSGSAVTFFQTYAWHDAWARLAAADARETPLIVAMRDVDGRVVAILPFAVRSVLGQKTLGWMAQSCSAYNMGLIDDRLLGVPGAFDMSSVIRAAREVEPGLGSIHLTGQPSSWAGAENPVFGTGVQLGSTPVYGMQLVPSFETMQERFSGRRRNRHRRSSRKLHAAGVTFEHITDLDERIAVFHEFVRQKGVQLARRSASNLYEQPAIAALYTELMQAPATRNAFVVYVAKHEGRYLAVSIGVRHAACYYDIMLSMDAGELETLSPGFLMVSEVIRHQCATGAQRFDFGPGVTELKATWEAQPLDRFDTLVTLTARGAPVTTYVRARNELERQVRAQPTLLRTAKLMKRALAAVAG